MRLGNKTLETTESLSENETAEIKIPRDRFVKEIDLYFSFTIDNGGGSAISVDEKDILSLIEKIRVVVNGIDTLIDVSGYRKFQMDKFTWNLAPYNSLASSIGAGGSADFEFEIPIVFAIDPAVEWDLRAVVPAHLTSSFYVYVDFGDPGDIDSNLSLSSGSITTTVKELYCNASEEKAILSKLQKVYEKEIEKDVTATHSDYTFVIDLDVGNVIQKLGIFAQDSAGDPSNTLVPKFMIKQESPIDLILEKVTWKQSRAEDRRIYDLETMPDGVTIWDAEYKTGGLDTRGLKSGDVVFKANTAASSGKVILYHREIA